MEVKGVLILKQDVGCDGGEVAAVKEELEDSPTTDVNSNTMVSERNLSTCLNNTIFYTLYNDFSETWHKVGGQ